MSTKTEEVQTSYVLGAPRDHIEFLPPMEEEYFSNFGPLYTRGVRVNGELSPVKYVIRGGEEVANVSHIYKLFPNELALEAADKLAREVGAVPFDKFTGNWFERVHSHVMYNKSNRHVKGRTVMRAYYAFNEPVAVGKNDDGSDDTVQLGFSIFNGINGKRGFGAGGFTFRHACKNIMLLGLGDSRKKLAMGFDDRVTLAYSNKRHTTSLDEKFIIANIKNIIKAMEEVTAKYRAMVETKILERKAVNIANQLPRKAIRERMSYIRIPEKDGEDYKLVKDVTEWRVFNDVTWFASHDPKSGLETKEKIFRMVENELLV